MIMSALSALSKRRYNEIAKGLDDIVPDPTQIEESANRAHAEKAFRTK